MAILVRRYEDKDYEGLSAVHSVVYRNGRPFEPNEKIEEPGERSASIAVLDGRIVGGYRVLHHKISRGAAVLSCGGIAGVAVAPEARQQGIGSAMMNYALCEMKEEGHQIATLYAFRESYYRQFGYEVVGQKFLIKCPSQRYPQEKQHMEVRRLSVEEWPALDRVCRKFAQRRAGLWLRSEARWRKLLETDPPRSVYAVGDPILAYMIVQHEVDFWKEQAVEEFVWSHIDGYRSLLSFLVGLGSNKTSLSWFEPSDGPFWSNYYDQGIEIQMDKPIMARVLDVPSSLLALTCPEKPGSFSVEVIDHQMPENKGPWQVQWNAEQVEVSRATEADFSMRIEAFSQALLGQPSFSDHLENGQVAVSRTEALDTARQFFQAFPALCLDKF